MKVKSADRMHACLIVCTDQKRRIRIYDENNLGVFKDYDVRHSDLWFDINDEDAYLYEDGDRMWIDHSPATLGEEE